MIKISLSLLLLAGLTACQPANPQATASPKPNPTISATVDNPLPSGKPSLKPEPSTQATASPSPEPSTQATASPSPASSASPTSDFGQPLSLKYQIPLRLNSANLQLNFTELTQESRCPSDVTCIWAGEVAVKVQLTQDSQILGIAELTLGADPAKASAKLGDYQLTLLDVNPYPVSTQGRQPQDYQVTVQLDVALDLVKNKPQKTL